LLKGFTVQKKNKRLKKVFAFPVTFAGGIFQFSMIQNSQMPARVIDNSRFAQIFRGMRKARSMDAQITGDLAVRQHQFVASDTVVKHQQPRAETLFDRVIIVADDFF
jgi:hypothetical protein